MGIHSFLRPFPNFRSKPHLLFEKLDLVGLPIFENLWKNAFTLDKVIFFTEGNRPGQNMDRCTVGGVSCIPVLAASGVSHVFQPVWPCKHLSKSHSRCVQRHHDQTSVDSDQ